MAGQILLTTVNAKVDTKLDLAGGTLTGPLYVESITGNGYGLSSLNAANVIGLSMSATGNGYALYDVNAANLTGMLSTSITYPEFVGGVDTKFIGSGEFLGALDATKITKGPLGAQYLPPDITLAGNLVANNIIGNIEGSLVFQGAVNYESSSGTFMASDGTVNTPSFTFVNDVQSGMWRSAASGAIGLTIGGSQTLAASGQKVAVGNVGTSLPAYELHVFGNVYATDTMYGNGYGLSSLNAANVTGALAASSYSGNGYGLSSLNAANVIGLSTSATGNGYALYDVNAANLTGMLSTSITYPEFVGGVDTKFIGSGEFLGALDATKITKGPIGAQYLPPDVTLAGNLVANNVGIGTLTPGYELHVVGNIYATQDIIAFSDQSVKGNVRILDDALNRVCQLNGYTFDRIDRGDSRRHAGLIAQEVVGVLDEIVYKNADGTLALAYQNMVALLVEAIKELRSEISDLQADIQARLAMH